MEIAKKILSIQSSVVYGRVGNRSATFPLEVLGYDVCPFNTVQLSTHTHYPVFDGDASKPTHAADISAELNRVWAALKSCQLDGHFEMVLTGYCGSEQLLTEVAQIVKDIRQKRQKDVLYLCDPVFGDFGRFYHPSFSALVAPYRDLLMPLATFFIPNQFELEQISGVQIETEVDLWKAVSKISSVPCVVVTSTSICPDKQILWLYCCQRKADNSVLKHKFIIPRVSTEFVGSGDVFAALLLAHFDKSDHNLREAVEVTVRTMRAVLLKTYEKIKHLCPNEEPGMWQKELSLIESKTLIESPPVYDEIKWEVV